jgi:hypothetical protein
MQEGSMMEGLECGVCECVIEEDKDLCIICEAELLALEVDLDLTKKSKRALLRDIDDAAADYLDRIGR